MLVSPPLRQVGGESAFQYKVQVRSLQMLERLVHVVQQLDDVVHVTRGDMDDMLHDSPTGFWENARAPPNTT